jgi:tetratricopeptide (TPR) repeat protein
VNRNPKDCFDAMLKIFRKNWGFTLVSLMVLVCFTALDPLMGVIAALLLIAIWAYVISKGWGDYLMVLGRYDRAIGYFTRKIDSNAENAQFYTERGNAHYFKGDAYAALRDYKKVLELQPKNTFAYVNLGNAYVKIGDEIAALTSYENALFLQPQNFHVFNNRGILLKKQRRVDEALADFNEAIRLAPEYSTPYYLRGNIFFERRDYVTALKNYRYAWRCKPKMPQAQAGTANALHAMGKVRQAKNTWKSVVKQKPSYQNPEWLRSELEWAAPLVDEARKLIAESGK